MENYSQTQQVMSVKDWFVTLFITAIPIIGFIMLFVWGFGDGTNITKQNYAKGALLLFALVIVFYFLIFMMFAATFI